jgi:hypothetical protein
MRKVLLVLILILMILMIMGLSGCSAYDESAMKECRESGGIYNISDMSCDYSRVESYTKDEIDAMLDELRDELESRYITEAYLWSYFYDNYSEDIIEYMEENYQQITENE